MTTLDQCFEAIDVAYAGDAYQAQAAYTRCLSWVPEPIARARKQAVLAQAKETRRLARVEAIEAWRLGQLVKAGSAYLNRPLRTEHEARQAIAERNNARRLC